MNEKNNFDKQFIAFILIFFAGLFIFVISILHNYLNILVNTSAEIDQMDVSRHNNGIYLTLDNKKLRMNEELFKKINLDGKNEYEIIYSYNRLFPKNGELESISLIKPKKGNDIIDFNNEFDGIKEKIKLDGEIVKVKMTNNENKKVLEFTDKETLNLFNSSFSNSIKLYGIFDIILPNYNIEITYSNGQTQVLFLWINDKNVQINLMKKEDSHTLYSLSINESNNLKEIIK